MRKSVAVPLLAAFAATFPLAASAEPVTLPPGLLPGEQYRLVFVTSTTTNAGSIDISYYNNFVNSLANSPGSPLNGLSTWTAIGSANTVNAYDNTLTHPGVNLDYPIYNLAGSLVASTNSVLWGGTLSAPIDFTDVGSQISVQVWTGTQSNGVIELAEGLGSTFAGQVTTVEAGNSASTNGDWVAAGLGEGFPVRAFPDSLYAISGVITVPTPEPSSIVLACLAAVGLGMGAIRRRQS